MARSPQADKHRQVGESSTRRDTAATVRERVDAKLDEALKATFPASDPFALSVDVSSADHDEPEATTEKAADAK